MVNLDVITQIEFALSSSVQLILIANVSSYRIFIISNGADKIASYPKVQVGKSTSATNQTILCESVSHSYPLDNPLYRKHYTSGGLLPAYECGQAWHALPIIQFLNKHKAFSEFLRLVAGIFQRILPFGISGPIQYGTCNPILCALNFSSLSYYIPPCGYPSQRILRGNVILLITLYTA